uniref:T9SS type A sorting domain-containing protein n=1 Tax=Flavobacterium sp. TaxID=239 RepID=UPI0040490D7B
MKSQIQFFIMLFCVVSIQLNAQNLDWAKNIGSTFNDYGTSISTDTSGNVYIAGNFQGTVDFDPSETIYNLTSVSPSSPNAFLAKFDALGNFIWAKSISVSSFKSMVLDNLGNIFLVGNFDGTVDFNPDPGVTFNLTANDETNVFILKLNSSGNFEWCKTLVGDHNVVKKVNYDGLGNILLVGTFNGTVDFDPNSMESFNLTGFFYIFILKLTTSGDFVWVKEIKGAVSQTSKNIAADSSGNIYISGEYYQELDEFNPFNSFVDFDPSEEVFNLDFEEGESGFLLKLDGLGNFVWVKKIMKFSSSGLQPAYNLSDFKIDNQGNLYNYGYFSGTVDFDPSEANYSFSTPESERSMFVSKLDQSGNFIWAKSLGNYSEYLYTASMSLDASSNLYLSGTFIGTIDVDPSDSVYNLISGTTAQLFEFLYDSYVVKLDSSGIFEWGINIKGLTGSGGGLGESLTNDTLGNVYFTGRFHGTSDFDPSEENVFNLSSGNNNSDAFILKLSQIEPETFPNIGMSGTLTNFADGADIVMDTEDGITYTAENISFPPNGVVKFRQDGNWTVNWGSTDFPSGTGTQGGADIPVPFGSYDVTFNYTTGAYTFTALPSEFPVIGLIGEFNDWSQSVNMFTEDGENYTLPNFYFPAPGGDPGVKFRQDNDWAVNWGGASFPSGTAVLGGQNNIPVQQGFYNISFNLTTLAYSFEPIALAITGTADIDFGIDTVMNTEDGITHTLNNKALSDGLLKFRTVGSWDVNFGSNTFPMGVGVSNGDNIPITSGIYNITFNRLTGAYNFTPIFIPTTQVSTLCGQTLVNINTKVFFDNVIGASEYMFSITNTMTNQQQTITSSERYFYFMDFENFELGATYIVKGKAQVNGNYGEYGSSCFITTPATPPTSQLRPEYCNTTLTTLNANVYADVVVGASMYKFKLANGMNEQEVERPDSRFSMAYATGIMADTSYDVSVSVMFNDTWSEYGAVCTITTPASLPTTQLRSSFCNGTVAALNSNFYASVKVGATAYKFKTMVNGEEVEVVRPDSRCYMVAFPGAMMDQTYSIQVSVQFNGVWSDYGNACNLTVGTMAPKLQLTEATQAFDIKAYPNPFMNQIILSLSNENTPSEIMVYDMTGKLIQQIATEETTLEIVNNWSKGIYLVQIVQGQETKNIRIVKQ